MAFLDKLVYRDLRENEVCPLRFYTNRYIKLSLGGTAPGFWGDVGLPGARGRAGGKLLKSLMYAHIDFLCYLAPGALGAAGNPGPSGYRGLPGDAVSVHK